ncbi:MAG: hypothetical protein KDB23_09000, partial [Planctomycetales bacterium]|nr:hypothetical protein [Planctomycetales bacterium]
MNWPNVKLIFLREMRDQLRDRRTLFMIAVLPMLLYPLMGMTFFQVLQFMQEHPTKVVVVGAATLPADPALMIDGQFNPKMFSKPERARLLEVERPEQDVRTEDVARWAQLQLDEGRYDAVVYFPPDFSQKLTDYTNASGRIKSTGIPHPR